jgi:hypothetical protein
MSLWARYLNERAGFEAIEEEWGFLTYSVKPPLCVLQDIYVAPEFRGSTKVLSLMSRVTQIAREAKCSHFWVQVFVGENTTERALRADLAYGFKVIEAHNGRIIMTKEIGGSDGN